jgi:hypothetical protein
MEWSNDEAQFLMSYAGELLIIGFHILLVANSISAHYINRDVKINAYLLEKRLSC